MNQQYHDEYFYLNLYLRVNSMIPLSSNAGGARLFVDKGPFF